MDAASALLGGTGLRGCKKRVRHGGLSGPQMARMASSYGACHDGDAVYAQ